MWGAQPHCSMCLSACEDESVVGLACRAGGISHLAAVTFAVSLSNMLLLQVQAQHPVLHLRRVVCCQWG
jgi:hypothetical protein